MVLWLSRQAGPLLRSLVYQGTKSLLGHRHTFWPHFWPLPGQEGENNGTLSKDIRIWDHVSNNFFESNVPRVRISPHFFQSLNNISERLVCFRQRAECQQYSFPWEIHTGVLLFLNQIVIKFMVLFQILDILWKIKYSSSPRGAQSSAEVKHGEETASLQENTLPDRAKHRVLGDTQPSPAAGTAFSRRHFSWDLKGSEWGFWAEEGGGSTES